MRNLLTAAVLATLVLPGASRAESIGNDLSVLPPLDARNVLTLSVAGSYNALSISQVSNGGASQANRMTVSIEGDRNGRAASSDLMPQPLIEGLPWGSLSQEGQGNRMDWSVGGSDNLLAAVQRGDGNSLQASIAGMGNLAAVSQTGNNNVAAFSQTGNGNMMSITQTSW